MIKAFAHKGLEKFYQTGSLAGVQPIHAKRLRLILALLNQAHFIEDINAPGLNLHKLQGTLQSFWSVTVQANWRVIFQFNNGDAYLVNYLDYH